MLLMRGWIAPKTKLGVEFPFTRIFYKYRPLRSVDAILAELASLDECVNI